MVVLPFSLAYTNPSSTEATDGLEDFHVAFPGAFFNTRLYWPSRFNVSEVLLSTGVLASLIVTLHL